MFKKLLVTLVAFLLAGACVLAAGAAAEPATGVRPIEADSPCPAVGCASGSCHGFDDVPEADGVHEMTCPEASCASTECHAWDKLATLYYQAVSYTHLTLPTNIEVPSSGGARSLYKKTTKHRREQKHR